MRTLTYTLLIFLISLSVQAQQILIIGKGEPWSGCEKRDIMRYFSEKGPEFSWIDAGLVNWREKDLSDYDIIWLHRADSAAAESFENEPDFLKSMLSYAEEGGSILLTQHALDFLNKSGLEKTTVEHRSKETIDNGYGRMLGFHAFRHHALFDSLNGGAYIWKPSHDTTVTQCGFFGDRLPQNGRVIGVDWDYIFVRENSKLIVEYEVGKGKVLGVGAYLNLFVSNVNRQHFDLFYRNVFDYLSGRKEGSECHFWLYGDHQIIPLQYVLERQFIPPVSQSWHIEENWMALGRDRAADEYCEVAGRRMLLTAYEPGGIFELWAHPFMAFREYSAMVYFEGQKPVMLGDMLPAIEVTPESIVRTYSFGNGASLREVTCVSPGQPVGVIHYEYEGPEARLGIQYKSNMRLMWPYSGKVLKTLFHGYQPGLNAIEFNAPGADLITLVGASKIPVSKYSGKTSTIEVDFPAGEILSGQYNPDGDTLFEVAAGQLFELNANDCLDIVFAAGNEGRDTLVGVYMQAMMDPEQIYRDALLHYRGLQEDMLSIRTPDDDLNMAYAWSLAATERFFVTTPGLGTSIVAGYNGTDRGWDGGHSINGRPGYAWYFGRDAAWSAFAILAYGDFEGVRQVLDMFMRYQDLNGKIYHELSTSGFVHYDASDATPLFIVLAGRYMAQSGDTAYIRENWPSIDKAIEYCLSTDTDGDGLIENTNVGHGWVEGGHLFGSHTSLYLASCWGWALQYADMMQSALGFVNRDLLGDKADEVRFKVTDDLYDENSGFFYQGVFSDGTFHTEQSIMPAVTMYIYPQLKHDPSGMLNAYSSQAYTSDWGVRMTSLHNPNYHPRGYHSGAVWPLYTGWVSLAEYAQGRPLQAFTHMMSNMNICRDFSLGYTEEVLNGEKYLPSGVCPHQCWSQTMALQPAIEGMLGLIPEEFQWYFDFAPNIPPHWDTLSIRNIRSSKGRWHCDMKRSATETSFSLYGEPTGTKCNFMPAFMPGTNIHVVEVNGEKAEYRLREGTRWCRLELGFAFDEPTEIKVWHSGGISLVPPVEKPARGVTSRGIRIIDASWEDDTYTIEVEGAPARSYELEVVNHFGTPVTVEGAGYRKDGDRLFLRLDFPALNRVYTPRSVKISF
jgi:glycogen debranching enzyme